MKMFSASADYDSNINTIVQRVFWLWLTKTLTNLTKKNNVKEGKATVTDKRLSSITKKILSWYHSHKRDLPWRNSVNPYHIWVSEIMLQQTQVETVIPYYHRFLSRFPTVQSLAAASQDAVLKAWENMGYYSRARNLHAAASHIVERFGGEIPDDWEDLVSLPGIGKYTAGAILSIAFGLSVPAVDANLRRVISRLFAVQDPVDEQATSQHLWRLAEDLVPSNGAGQFNQALMDLGATICAAKKPTCEACPVRECCQAYDRGLQETLPITKKRKPVPHHHMTAGIITDKKGRFLLTQRLRNGLLGGLWKFPGGKQKKGESLKKCVVRETGEEIGIHVRVEKEIASAKHAYTHFRITLHAFHCVHLDGVPKALGCSQWRWARKDQFRKLAFSKADHKIILALA
jgi:A/G-specific adenine glycosylase